VELTDWSMFGKLERMLEEEIEKLTSKFSQYFPNT
jgi:hypothetical protein